MGIASDYDFYPVGFGTVEAFKLNSADMMFADYDPLTGSFTSNTVLFNTDSLWNVGFGTIQSYKIANTDVLNSSLDLLTGAFTSNATTTSQELTYNVGFGAIQSYKIANTDILNSAFDPISVNFVIPNFGIEGISNAVYMSAFAIMPTFAFTSNSYAILSRQVWVTGS